MAVLGARRPRIHIQIIIRALKKMHLALAAYMWGRLIGVFFLVSLKLCFYYSLSVEITQKPPNSPFLGFPRALYRNSAQLRKTALSGAAPRSILGAEQPKKDVPET